MSLFVVKRGFRLPHNRTELEQNLLFLETQLGRYMHSHEPVPEEDGGGPPAE